MADVIQFANKAQNERDALIAQARANYESIFPTAPSVADGSKARIKRRRQAIGLEHMFHGSSAGGSADLTMGHADPEDNGMPCDVAYCAPDTDLA